MGASHSSWWCSTICSALVHHHDAWFLAAQFLCQNLVAQKDQLAKQKDAVVKMNAKLSLGLKTVDLTHEGFHPKFTDLQQSSWNGLGYLQTRAIHGLSEVRSSTPSKLTPRPWADQKIEGWTEIEERHIYIYLYYKFTLYKYNIHMHVYIDMYICSSRLCYAHVRVVFSIKHAIWGGAKFDTSWQKTYPTSLDLQQGVTPLTCPM